MHFDRQFLHGFLRNDPAFALGKRRPRRVEGGTELRKHAGILSLFPQRQASCTISSALRPALVASAARWAS
jgi:hypothetical protein